MATASDVSDYFVNTPENLTLLRMLPCTSGPLANNSSVCSYNSERMMKQAVPVTTNVVMFMGEERDGGGGQWPQQETLTLLEVRARLNTRFRQSTQKGPLWDEVSRIMAEEYGYNRSRKKCKEKLENLYKYYKKTKRRGQNHSVKEVRTSAFNVLQSSPMCEDLEFSLSILNDWDDSSTEEEVQDDKNLSLKGRRNRQGSSLKELIKLQIRRLVEMQVKWLDKISTRIEQLEQERISREEKRRREEAARFELNQQMWNTEQAQIIARDNIFIQALERISRDREGVTFLQNEEIVRS